MVGVSKDALKSHGNFREKYDLKMPLLSDPELEMIKAYGGGGAKAGSKEGALRVTVVVAPDGTIAAFYPKVKAKGHAQQVLEDLGG